MGGKNTKTHKTKNLNEKIRKKTQKYKKHKDSTKKLDIQTKNTKHVKTQKTH